MRQKHDGDSSDDVAVGVFGVVGPRWQLYRHGRSVVQRGCRRSPRTGQELQRKVRRGAVRRDGADDCYELRGNHAWLRTSQSGTTPNRLVGL